MKTTPTHVLHATHELLVGKQSGLFIGVCLGCGQLLGASRRLRFLIIADRFHLCTVRFGLTALVRGY